MQFVAFSTLTHATVAPTGDHLALLAIKYMITDDPQGAMTSWNNSMTFCQWQGVTCGSRHHRVTMLDLSSRELRLYKNSFTGNIPDTITNCSDLQVLHLGDNNLVGKIPDGIGLLSMLKKLILHRNILKGGIPPFISNFTFLETLSLDNCQLGGSFPDIFQRLSNLRRLVAPSNNLTGSIPPSLYNCSSLEQVFLDDNQLNGRLQENLGLIMPRLRLPCKYLI
ncbi:hypothetical protein E3N88_12959 [Mikania micrantha]|uniref:Leucine-rich repeat-containing N-terminal plant-type domain-containing protein n=1 Tax=Mikania micrantha TaxID=192012 RepID=A0A5N6P753_9ASTR|nr:hypothetical protein E3N88_12959 [Mikania micrantha]